MTLLRSNYGNTSSPICSLIFAVLTLTAPCVAHAQQLEASLPSAPAPAFAAPSAFTPPEAAPESATSSSLSGVSVAPDATLASDATLIQDTPATNPSTTPKPKAAKQTPASEIAIEGFVSYGNWQIFAAGIHEELYTAGVEYDRHSWGQFIGAQMDYVAEVLPVVILKEPRILNVYGVRRSRPGDDILIPGFAFSPIGLRMQWRPNKTFKPYFNVKGGAIGFTQKALSPAASYYDFSLQESIGFYVKMTPRWDMRFGLFGDYHFSNAYITTYNPGLDVMNSNIAFSYHFGGDQSEKAK